jgi:hypothetical protein
MTATEWFAEQLGITEIVGPEYSGLIRIYAEAKEMQKKQLLDFGSKVAMKAHSGQSGWSIEQLYNEMFEK